MDLLVALNSVPLISADAPPVGGTPQYGTDGDPATNTPATQFPAYWVNGLLQELSNLIVGSGQAMDRNQFDQIYKSVQKLIQRGAGTYIADTGAVNALAIAPAPALTAYAGGQRFLVIPANTNTGAATINVNGLGAKSIVHPDGTNVIAGDITAGVLIEIAYQATLGKFVLITNVSGVTINQFTQSITTGSYWTRFPNGVILQGTTWNVTPVSTTNTPPSTKWGQTLGVTWPVSFPSGLKGAVATHQITNNGQFKLTALQPSFTSFDVYATCWDDPSVGLPMSGWAFGWGN